MIKINKLWSTLFSYALLFAFNRLNKLPLYNRTNNGNGKYKCIFIN